MLLISPYYLHPYMVSNFTPVPHAVVNLMPMLKDAEWRVIVLITTKTLGWKSETTASGRKERDWIAGSQFEKDGGVCSRALSIATQSLIDKGYIIVTDYSGDILDTPEKRKGKFRLYYRLSPQLLRTSADYAEEIRTKRRALAHKMRTTQ